jgi:hypothetical protein
VAGIPAESGTRHRPLTHPHRPRSAPGRRRCCHSSDWTARRYLRGRAGAVYVSDTKWLVLKLIVDRQEVLPFRAATTNRPRRRRGRQCLRGRIYEGRLFSLPQARDADRVPLTASYTRRHRHPMRREPFPGQPSTSSTRQKSRVVWAHRFGYRSRDGSEFAVDARYGVRGGSAPVSSRMDPTTPPRLVRDNRPGSERMAVGTDGALYLSDSEAVTSRCGGPGRMPLCRFFHRVQTLRHHRRRAGQRVPQRRQRMRAEMPVLR